MTRGRRGGILKSEKTRHVVKIGPMHLKGVWYRDSPEIPLFDPLDSLVLGSLSNVLSISPTRKKSQSFFILFSCTISAAFCTTPKMLLDQMQRCRLRPTGVAWIVLTPSVQANPLRRLPSIITIPCKVLAKRPLLLTPLLRTRTQDDQESTARRPFQRPRRVLRVL